MRYLLQIAFIFFSLAVQAQGWKDTLDLARKAYKNEDYGKALEYYEKVQKTAPESLDLSDEMGQSAYKLREFEKAEKIYQQGSGNKKSTQERANNYHNLGNARMKQKNYQGAIDAYKDALRLQPDDDQTRYNLSEATRKLKEEQKKEQNQGGQDRQNPNQNNSANQNNGNQNNNNSAQNNSSQGQNPGQNQNSAQNNNSSNKGNGEKDKGNPSQSSGTLPNNTVERMLDDLTKAEAETKRKISGNSSYSKSPKSGKDW
jgi:tetratricopeptide (TPR) repeat protein